ncbi:hypothetical protein L2X99_13055 [Microbacterium sp. KUDC0406]|uniref:hypothetical protein n=1 Tax=Microbacterium sp. KUDC0406 TaxID=2909588 RepID=UPI001F393713|nr:hypothetical protein [Microbacterium sp. KUDC0406]UJP09356.1 hypothetical protein L2X99_13055 [Microbacterium sp. KUDC0406]
MGIIVKFLLIALVAVLVIGMVMRMFRRPTAPQNTGPRQQRMPLFVPLIGWLLLITGLGLALAGFSARPGTDPMPMRIGAVVSLILGLLVLLMHRNRYVQPDADGVRFRTFLGREKTIAYRDVTAYRVTEAGWRSHLRLRAADGTRMQVNPAVYDMSPVLAAIRFKERTGRWPSPGEPR